MSAAQASASFSPAKLLVSTSVWSQDANITAGTTQLPPGCSTSPYAADPCATAEAGGTYPQVFNNHGVDPSFGVTQPIVLDELDPTTGTQIASQTVPSSLSTTASGDQLVTSFSSSSELAVNRSTDGNYVTFMGEVAPVAALDASGSDTPGVVDPTNGAGTSSAYYRGVASLDTNGAYQFTQTNAYSGSDPRAAIFDPSLNSIYATGNAGNGSNPEPQGVVTGTGSQIFSPSNEPEVVQSPGGPVPLGNFNITELGGPSDKSARDNNYQGLTVSGNVIYFTKPTGTSGVNTVYFLDTTGTSCASGGVGLPAAGAQLPAASSWSGPAYSTSNPALGLTVTNPGLSPTNACILNGFPTALAKNATDASGRPAGIWFANSTTLYVADEGAGDNTYSAGTGGPSGEYTAAAASTAAGLQKWSLVNGAWTLDYVLQDGLNPGNALQPCRLRLELIPDRQQQLYD